jgi:hypothetical protein
VARKPRDYKAEYARRNALARERGFRTYGQQRHRVATGKALPVGRQGWAQSGYKSAAAYRKAIADAGDYQALHAGTKIARYETGLQPASGWDKDKGGNRKAGTSVEAYTKAYTDAFVYGSNRYGNVRHSGGSEELRYYMVDVTGYYTQEEYDSRYGNIT